jgi:transcriptional regulator with XRE-family HTH domain
MMRELAQRQGLNTAALAKKIGLERSRLKKVLAGQESMTVDELIVLSEGLELDAHALAQLPRVPDQDEAIPLPVSSSNAADMALPSTSTDLDPYGNHAEQLMRFAFDLGCDIFCLFDSTKIEESGIPVSVRSQYPENLPLRLEAVYHHQNQPVFKPSGLQLSLSFDSLYSCLLPWSAFLQITLFPLPWDPLEDAPEEQRSAPQPGPSHLRLLD